RGEDIDARAVAVGPGETHGIVADERSIDDLGAGQRAGGEAQLVGFQGRGAALFTTGRAGAIGAQPAQRIRTVVSVLPFDAQHACCAVNGQIPGVVRWIGAHLWLDYWPLVVGRLPLVVPPKPLSPLRLCMKPLRNSMGSGKMI